MIDPVVLEKKINNYNPKEDTSGKEEEEILQILYKMCRDLTLFNVDDRLNAFHLLASFNKVEFSSELNRLQMRFIHIYNDNHPSLDSDVELLRELAKSSKINPSQRLGCLAVLYKYMYFDQVYDICQVSSMDLDIPLVQRKDFINLLVGSGNPDYITSGIEACLNTIDNGTFENSKDILGLILPIGQETGLPVGILDQTIDCEYNEDNCVLLFERYFNNIEYNVHYKIICAQFLIQTSPYEKGEKRKDLLETLYKIGTNEEDSEIITQGMRGDCGDFLINWSEDEKYKQKGIEIIDQIKFANVPVGMRNIYTNTENAHDDQITKCINNFILNRMWTNSDKVPHYNQEPTK
jgi:hypothetical protein